MGYRVLARGILHIYTQRQTVAARNGTVSLLRDAAEEPKQTLL